MVQPFVTDTLTWILVSDKIRWSLIDCAKAEGADMLIAVIEQTPNNAIFVSFFIVPSHSMTEERRASSASTRGGFFDQKFTFRVR